MLNNTIIKQGDFICGKCRSYVNYKKHTKNKSGAVNTYSLDVNETGFVQLFQPSSSGKQLNQQSSNVQLNLA